MSSKSEFVLVSIFVRSFIDWITLGVSLDPASVKFCSVGVSASNLEEILECPNQSNLDWKRYLSGKPYNFQNGGPRTGSSAANSKVI